MLLIATDEAGYGPKLGPLIITGTAWELQGHPNRDSLEEMYLPLRVSQMCGEVSVVVDDSKAVFKPSSGLATLHAVMSASLHWCQRSEDSLVSLLPWLVGSDLDAITTTPWLALQDLDQPWLEPQVTQDCLEHWQSTGLRLVGFASRVITAKTFNESCSHGANKADLLSETTLNLVKSLSQRYRGTSDTVDVYCDRHGGRRYYAGVLQHVFPDQLAQVVSESKQESAYRLLAGDHQMSVRFTVKGDTFTPVALASMQAKYLRERFMQGLNQYFATRYQGDLIPTAGYPVDADRFLATIQPVVQREKIPTESLVRSR